MIIDKQKDTVWAIRNEGGCGSLVVLELWARNSIVAGNAGDLEVLRRTRYAGTFSGGFNWDETPQPYDFWPTVLRGDPHLELNSIVDEVMDYIDFQHFN